MSNPKSYDVAILGTGIGGTILASILGKQGFRVLMLERESHPRFAVGEAMLPQSSMLMWILGERYGIPEIQYLSKTETIHEHVTHSCGVKRVIGFVYHEEGKRQDPEKAHMLVPPATPITSESHLFRQDIDLYLLKTAMRYGADYRERVEVTDVEIGSGGVRLRTDDGEEYHARYVVDGSGYRSVLASQFGLREEPSHLRTESRTIFTHMSGVKAYDDLLEPWEDPKLSARWNDGTLHHVFEGGWFWVIPFNNHKDAENPLCSVGLTLNMRKHPYTGAPPEEEFWDVVRRFPSIAAHFEDAKAVRPWVSTRRLQYSSTRGAGDRWFLAAHAHGFIDALYSRGLISTLDLVRALAPRLIEALQEDDFSRERFLYPERLQSALLDANDQIVHCSYEAFGSYPLWNAWVRLWLLTTMFGDFRLFRTIVKYLESQDVSLLDRLDDDPLPGMAPAGANPVSDMLEAGAAFVAQMEAGTLTGEEAAERIFEMLRCAPLPPVHGWADPDQHHLDFLPEKLGQLIHWGRTSAPPPFAQMFDFSPENYLQGLIGGPETASAPV